ncbi:6447_t:CDS:2, partial [Ambispora leptoticha]
DNNENDKNSNNNKNNSNEKNQSNSSNKNENKNSDENKNENKDKKRSNIEKRDEEYHYVIPQVIVFTSGNGGTPGIKEKYSGSKNVLKKALLGITLVTFEDMKTLRLLAENGNDRISINPEQGPWLALMSTYNDKSYSVSSGKSKFSLYPAVVIISLCSALILALSPGDIYEYRMPTLVRNFITYFEEMLLYIIFAIIEIPWKSIAWNVCRKNFVVRVISFAKIDESWAANTIKIAFIFDSLTIVLITLEFICFGLFILFALKNRIAFQIFDENRKRIRLKVSFLMLMIIISVSSSISARSLDFLSPTIKNFWIIEILQELATVLGCTIVFIILKDKIFARQSIKNISHRKTTVSLSTNSGSILAAVDFHSFDGNFESNYEKENDDDNASLFQELFKD